MVGSYLMPGGWVVSSSASNVAHKTRAQSLLLRKRREIIGSHYVLSIVFCARHLLPSLFLFVLTAMK